MDVRITKPSRNGKVEAPYLADGALSFSTVRSAQQTAFPISQAGSSVRTIAYRISRYRLGSAPLARYFIWLCLLLAVAWALDLVPGPRWVAGFWALICLAFVIAIHIFRRQDFVRFEVRPIPSVRPEPLSTGHKIAVFATGRFTVQGKYQRFTWLPGYVRTFATREHAILCQLTNTSYLGVARMPEDEIGMWYAFVMPDDVLNIEWGEIHFGPVPHPAVAISYRTDVAAGGRRKSNRTHEETLYLAFQADSDARSALANFLHDLPVDPARQDAANSAR